MKIKKKTLSYKCKLIQERVKVLKRNTVIFHFDMINYMDNPGESGRTLLEPITNKRVE